MKNEICLRIKFASASNFHGNHLYSNYNCCKIIMYNTYEYEITQKNAEEYQIAE